MSTVVSAGRGQPKGGTSTEGVAKPDITRRVLVPLLIMLLGLAVLLYPVVATQWNNWQQQKVAAEYQEGVEEAGPDATEAALESARIYNETHKDGPILDPWLARISKDNAEYQDYLKELSGYPAMSQVAIPAIDSNLPVYHGSSEETLQKGIGHLFGSALPIGGDGNHTVLTGHTGLTNATLWDNLIDVKKGDAIYLNTFGRAMKYEVHDIEIVLPDQTDSLKAREGEDLITLITCTPYGINTHRLLVHAHRVPMDPSEDGVFDQTNKLMQWWMWLILIIAAVALAGIIWWLRRQKQAAEAETQTEQPAGETATFNIEGEVNDEN